jgi:hypothetical protein
MHLMFVLPMLVSMGAITYQMVLHVTRFQELVTRQVQEESIVRDLVRRIRDDTASADSASAYQDGRHLHLSLADSKITYETADRLVRRIESEADRDVVYEWELKNVTASFYIETINDRPAVVWTTFTQVLAEQQGPDRVRRLSAAASIGRGGAK